MRERNLKLAEEQRARKEAGDTQPRAEEAQRCKAQEELEYKRRQAEKAAAELWKAEERQVEESASNTEESPPPPGAVQQCHSPASWMAIRTGVIFWREVAGGLAICHSVTDGSGKWGE